MEKKKKNRLIFKQIKKMYYTDKEIMARVYSLPDYKKNGLPSGLWLLGIRSQDDNPDAFDDRFYLMNGTTSILDTSGTTNAGVSVLTGGYEKYNNLGAAVLQSDRIYYKVWKYGKHLGKVDGLLQRGAEVSCFRDGNKNKKSEEIGTPITGWYGINFHIDQFNLRVDNPSAKVGNWSAGCQVCNNLADYKEIIHLTKQQHFVSYCLLKEWSI